MLPTTQSAEERESAVKLKHRLAFHDDINITNVALCDYRPDRCGCRSMIDDLAVVG